MSLEAQKTRITARIWQSIAQSGVDVSAVSRDRLDQLVESITAGVMQEFDAMLPELDLPQGAAALGTPKSEAAGEEEVLWEGRPFLTLNERYVVTTQRIRIVTGLIGRGHEDIEMIRLRDVDHTQGIGERLLNIGDVLLHSSDATGPSVVLRNVADPHTDYLCLRVCLLECASAFPYLGEKISRLQF